jgi:hypothetical protein
MHVSSERCKPEPGVWVGTFTPETITDHYITLHHIKNMSKYYQKSDCKCTERGNLPRENANILLYFSLKFLDLYLLSRGHFFR